MRKKKRVILFIVFGSGVVTALLAGLLISIFERKQEARTTFLKIAEITDTTEDPSTWGKNFPQHYEDYLRTTDQVRTRFGGSEAVQRTPTSVDPRSVVAQSKLEEDPRLKTLWAGYAFSADFREERGHAFMLIDQIHTERQQFAPQPGACINCHASAYVPMMKLGEGDLQRGFEKLNKMPYTQARQHVTHPVACIDCHEPDSMRIRVTRPAFNEGIRALKASQGIMNYDVNSMATRQEMRGYVCGQCHVEYYFDGPEKRLTFPWANGLRADEILAYYEAKGIKDWTHSETGTEALKAQHPEFEMWSQGVHARSGVTCVDCHMPYKRVGAMKITDHHIRSPLLNINNACLTCHRFPAEEVYERVTTIQSRHFELRNIAMDALLALIDDIKAASSAGIADEALAPARSYHRKAQFLLDFAEAENSTGFHAPQEAARVLGLSIDYARRGQVAARTGIKAKVR